MVKCEGIITVNGKKKKNEVHCNLGIIKPINWWDYKDLEGYWVFWKYSNNTYKIKDFFKK